MRVAVTGGAGYIGSFTTGALVAAGHEPVVLDNFSIGHRESVSPGIEIHEVDLADAARLGQILKDTGCEAVIHFAALTEVGRSVREPLNFWRVNLCGTLNLLEAMNAAGVKRIVFSSTAATYGNPVGVLDEQHVQHPINPYGNTKLAMEKLINDYIATGSAAGIALRYFNACGAALDGEKGEDHTPESHLIPRIMAAALGIVDKQRGYEGQIGLFGKDYKTRDGTCDRDYVHVKDLAAAHVLALGSLAGRPLGYCAAFNIGTGRGATVQEVLNTAQEIIAEERNIPKFRIPVVEGPRRAGDPDELVANSEKIQRELGWKPTLSLSDSLRSVYKWMTKYPKGYADKRK